jgi:hypothetical protein
MNADEKRRLENELTVMGLPGLDDPALIQSMADIVNGYPIPGERVEFFCDMLNECEGARRREMYEAMRPRLAFPIPDLDTCEARIAAKAERMIRPKGLPAPLKDLGKLPPNAIEIECGGCGKKAQFEGATPVAAMLEARKAGWGRGPKRGWEHCPDCRLIAMPVKVYGRSLSSASEGRVN